VSAVVHRSGEVVHIELYTEIGAVETAELKGVPRVTHGLNRTSCPFACRGLLYQRIILYTSPIYTCRNSRRSSPIASSPCHAGLDPASRLFGLARKCGRRLDPGSRCAARHLAGMTNCDTICFAKISVSLSLGTSFTSTDVGGRC